MVERIETIGGEKFKVSVTSKDSEPEDSSEPKLVLRRAEVKGGVGSDVTITTFEGDKVIKTERRKGRRRRRPTTSRPTPKVKVETPEPITIPSPSEKPIEVPEVPKVSVQEQQAILQRKQEEISKQQEVQKFGPRRDLLPTPSPRPVFGPAPKKSSIEKALGFVKELGSEFKAGFTLRESPTQSFTPEQQLQIALTGRNPITGEIETQTESRVKQLAGLLGSGTAIAVQPIGKGLGTAISKVPVVKQVATGIGNIATSKPVVAGLTFLAGKELAESSKEGSTEFARTGANIVKDVVLFGSVIKQLPVKPIDIKSPLKIVRVDVPTEGGVQTFRSLGLDVGTRAKPLVTTTPEGVKFGSPTIEGRIPVSELSSPIAQPETALGGKVLRSALELTPAETTRVESVVGAGRILGTDKGITPKDIIFNVEGLRSPEKASPLIEAFSREEGGVIFGSAVTQRLPEGFVSQKIGDVDIFIKSKSVAEVEPRLKVLTEQLRASGEDVTFNPEKLSIDFSKGGKLLEVKSGVDQQTLGLQDEAPAKFLGFDISDSTPVRFGQTESITAGQQFLRKGSAASITSPPTKGAEFPSFSEGGVVGKITPENPRGTKDIAGFIQTGEGLVAIRETSLNPFTRAKGRRAAEELRTFRESFTPEQQADINIKLKSLIGEPTTQRIRAETTEPVSVVGGFGSPRLSSTPEKFTEFTISEGKPFVESPRLVEPSVSSPIVSESFIPISDVSKTDSIDSSISITPSDTFKPISDFPSPSKGRGRGSPRPSPKPSPDSPISDISSPFVPSSVPPSDIPSLTPPSRGPPSDIPSLFPPSAPPSISPPVRPPSLSPLIGGASQPLFDVEVGRAGRKFFFEQRDLTLEQAISFGRSKVKGTAAASLRITPKDGVDRSFLTKIESSLGGEFRRSKEDEDVFVQRRGFRIGTAGEKEDITLLGIQATRRKDLKSLF